MQAHLYHAADKVAAAYLAAKDGQGYGQARVMANVDCLHAQFKERETRPDDMLGNTEGM
jgi:hypothetical protein